MLYMKVTFLLIILFLILDIICEFIFNIIVVSHQDYLIKNNPDDILIGDLETSFKLNRPPLLRNNKAIEFIIETGGFYFYIISCLLFLIFYYIWTFQSFFYLILLIPGMIFFKYFLNFLSILSDKLFIWFFAPKG